MENDQEENTQVDDQLPLRTVTAAILGYFPLALVGYLSFIARQDQAQLAVILNFMWVIGGVISVWVLYLQISFMQRPVRELNTSGGCLTRELIHTLVLAVILIASWFGFQALSPGFNGFDVFFGEISQDAARQAVFLTSGLLLWAVYEELTRVFTLSSTWELLKSSRSKSIVTAVNALVFALAYAYQGWGAMAAAGAGGLLLGAYYQKKGRLLPLILSHYLLNLAIFVVWIYLP